MRNSGLYLAQRPVTLSQEQEPLRVSMHCYGAGGANAHFVLEAAGPVAQSATTGQQLLFPFSAPTDSQLKNYLSEVGVHLANHPELQAEPVAYTLQQGREVYACRFAVLARTLPELQKRIAAYVQSNKPDLATSFYGQLTTQSNTAVPQEGNLDLARLALYWCNGYQIELCQQGISQRRVPFATLSATAKSLLG